MNAWMYTSIHVYMYKCINWWIDKLIRIDKLIIDKLIKIIDKLITWYIDKFDKNYS